LFKTKKNIENIYCTCKPLLLVKDDNYADEEYEEANEWGVTARRWRSIFWWSGKIVSHYGMKRPCYLVSGRIVGGQNQHWKKMIKNTNWHWNSFDGVVSRDTNAKPSQGPIWTPIGNDVFQY
jgi:hypothetical protein